MAYRLVVRCCFAVTCMGGLGSCDPVIAADPTAAATEPLTAAESFFEARIRPVLASRCLGCHGPKKQESGLRLDRREHVLTGGESGPAVVPGKPEESVLLDAVRYGAFEMPPDGPLPDASIADVERWILDGAAWPKARPVRSSDTEMNLSDTDRLHWSFQPVLDPGLPTVANPAWCRGGLDAFVLQRLEEAGLPPAEPADAAALQRRLYFDLVGVPPSQEERVSFLSDEDPKKYERLVDALLDDPRYGEKWGRHWLDVARFAESDGWRQDAFRPEAYHYRDYVVRSFNDDKPFDVFVREQVAGDELDPGNSDAITATAFYRHGIYEYNQRDVETQWDNILNEITDVIADAFLGMSVGCARCHDHKFDPVPQRDYFRLRAFFEPLTWREDQPVAGVARRRRFATQQAAWELATAEIRAKLTELEWPVMLKKAGGQGFNKFAPHLRQMMLKQPVNRTPREQQIAGLSLRQLDFSSVKLAEELTGADKEQWAALTAEMKSFDHLKPAPLPTRRFCVSDVGVSAPATVIPGRESEGHVEPGGLSVLNRIPVSFETPPDELRTTGRRSALAYWLTRKDHPLTPRVLVNRVWQYHFGTGLVSTADNFGRLGERPSHPELLDWLTSRFLEEDWRLKPLHRRILLSATYRQAASNPHESVARTVDPQNRLLWKTKVRRLEAESIRDALLAVSGELDPRIGGPSVPATSLRRSIYVKSIRNRPATLLGDFDMADGLRSTSRRNVTTTPLQALTLINGSFAWDRAGAFAKRVLQDDTAVDERIMFAYQLAFSRDPEPNELRSARQFLNASMRREPVDHDQAADSSNGERDSGAADAARASDTKPDLAAWTDFCHVLFNSNEFLYTN